MGQTLPCPLRVWWRERHPGSGGGISRFGVESVGNVGRGQINNGTHVASQYKNDTSIPEVLSTSVPFGSAATDQVTLWAVCGSPGGIVVRGGGWTVEKRQEDANASSTVTSSRLDGG